MATILVVDDETSIVDVLRDLITDEGHTPITATNGHDACSSLNSTNRP